jgi:HAE1 family hydrophobic/amphiphilic exporter-1
MKVPKNRILERFYTVFNVGFDTTTKKIQRSVEFFIKRKWLAFGGIALFAAILPLLLNITPKAFVPEKIQELLFLTYPCLLELR